MVSKPKTYCVEGRHKSNTINVVGYEKINPKKIVRFMKGTCSVCGRKK